jgi:hypothetical protein
MNEHIGQFLV